MDHRLWSTWKQNKLGLHPYQMPHKRKILCFFPQGWWKSCLPLPQCMRSVCRQLGANKYFRQAPKECLVCKRRTPTQLCLHRSLLCVYKIQNRWLILLAVWMVANIWNKILKAANIVWMTLDEFNHFLTQRTVSSPSEQAQSIWMELFNVV